MSIEFNTVLDLLGGGEQQGSGFIALCPVHGDTNPSLRVTLKDDGRVLMHCWSHECRFADIVAAIGLDPGDLRHVESNGHPTSSALADKTPPSADHIRWLTDFVEEAADRFIDSPAAEYALRRWGITEAHAQRLRLGFTDRTIRGDYIDPTPWRSSERIVVPLTGFDGTHRGVQGRALGDDATRWCSLSNPDDSTAWARLGVMAHDHGDDYVQLGEGPGDALTAYAAGTGAVFMRGTMAGTAAVNQIVAGTAAKVVIVAGDADTAGQAFNTRMGEALAAAGIDVRVLDIPNGHGDVTEWREDNPSAFPRAYAVALRGASPFTPTPSTPPPPASSGGGKAYMNTHEGNAQRLIDAMGGDLAFVPQLGRMIYVGGQWKPDELHTTVHEFTKVTYSMLERADEILEEADRTGNGTLEERGLRLKSWATASQNSPHFDKSIQRAEQLSSMPLKAFDQHGHLLNCSNGTVDLRTGTLRDHDRDDLITHRLDVAYNPDAECPRWVRFLDEVFPGEPDLPRYMQRVAGYAATGGPGVEQCLICCVGGGSNGKSLYWSTVQYVLESLTGTIPMSAFEKRQAGATTADLAYLRGKRLALIQEGEANQTLSESVLKRCTGMDSLSARALYRQPMSFVPEFLIVMATNHLPRIRGADESIWRRMRLVRFKKYFGDDERDPYLFKALRAESEGILRWIVDGAREWHANGLGDPPSVKEATAAYRHTADELAGFVGMVIAADPDASVAGSDLMAAYMDWCVEENVRAWSRRALYEAVCERLPTVSKEKRRDGVHLIGLRLEV